MKQEDPEEVVHAIRDVLAGRIYVSEEVLVGGAKGSPARGAEPKSRPLGQLTDMELEVLELLGEGKTDPEIARQLRVRAGTASAHCTQIKKKLNLKSINALIRYAVCWVEGGKAWVEGGKA
jgi:DNA-binding NarL/FixJ family response regulator